MYETKGHDASNFLSNNIEKNYMCVCTYICTYMNSPNCEQLVTLEIHVYEYSVYHFWYFYKSALISKNVKNKKNFFFQFFSRHSHFVSDCCQYFITPVEFFTEVWLCFFPTPPGTCHLHLFSCLGFCSHKLVGHWVIFWWTAKSWLWPNMTEKLYWAQHSCRISHTFVGFIYINPTGSLPEDLSKVSSKLCLRKGRSNSCEMHHSLLHSECLLSRGSTLPRASSQRSWHSGAL